ncbi:hypothetical protein B0H14DRAFT_2575015 [Mycena olivaceomarginata]|nr:hypothetical protein B0H14DRAFT_2575015 [Mycena olivaceomarginata]
MARDIHRHAQESLRLDGDELFPLDSDSDSMPDLVSIYSSSSDSDDRMQALEQEFCDLCWSASTRLLWTARCSASNGRIWEDKKDGSGQGDLQMDADDSPAPTMTLVAAAREACLAFEEFTVEFDVPHEGAASAGTIALLARETEGTGEVVTGTNSDEGNGNGNVAVGIIRAASPVQRAESPYPRLIRETRGYATARAQDAAARVQRATRSLPSNPRRGELITREFWSSSPSPPSSDPSSPYDNDEYADEEVEMREMYRQETMSPGNWSPAVSDWSVEEFDLLPPFCVDPQHIVNWAVSRALNDLGAMSLGHEFASDEDSDADSREGLEAHAELPSTAESEEPPRVAHRDSGSVQLVHELMRWIYEGKAHQQTHLHFEDEMGCEPANCALRALHGPLSTFVDYAAMAAEGILDLCCPSPPPYGLENYLLILDDTPSSDASSTSLDHSLPGCSLQLPMSADRSTAEDEVESGAPENLEAMEVQQSAGLKRKNPDGEAGGLNQQGMCKKTSKFFGDSLRRVVLNREAVKATGLPDGTVVRFMAGVRLAILEAGRRIEDMVWHRYGITDVRDAWPRKTGAAANFRHNGMFQHSIPTRFLHHPLLFDVEVAKLQTLWHILQRNSRIKLADALHELLSIKLRNEYVVSHILNCRLFGLQLPGIRIELRGPFGRPRDLVQSSSDLLGISVKTRAQNPAAGFYTRVPGTRKYFLALVITMVAGSAESAGPVAPTRLAFRSTCARHQSEDSKTESYDLPEFDNVTPHRLSR